MEVVIVSFCTFWSVRRVLITSPFFQKYSDRNQISIPVLSEFKWIN